MKKINVIFESPKAWHRWLIEGYLKRGFKVWVIEPFWAYHHEKGIRYFPHPLPGYINKMLKSEKISLLMAEKLNVEEMNSFPADMAVEIIEKVYPEYKKQNKFLVSHVCNALRSPIAENIFKRYLCDRLAVFYSVNMMLEKIGSIFPEDAVIFYSEKNMFAYRYFKRLLIRCGQEVLPCRNINFSSLGYLSGFLGQAGDNLISMSRLLAQTVISGLLSCRRISSKKKVYKYGITIISPSRQLVGGKRGPDFIVDNKKIQNSDIIYFPVAALNVVQKKKLREFRNDILYAYSKWRNFSHFPRWLILLWICLVTGEWLRTVSAINITHGALTEYFRWDRILKRVKIKHFITHCDFRITHIPRNIAFKQNGIETWYFTDSMNFKINFKRDKDISNYRNPFLTYLYYDHFVTWEKTLADYFSSHPESFRECHVIGCLWADGHVNGDVKKNGKFDNKFIIAAYDSTYSRNSLTSYKEGIAFGRDLLKLADENPDIAIILKEKKARPIHVKLDPILGPVLLALYDEMSRRPNIKVFGDHDDASAYISGSDMVISFPFTSTTFEALSVNKPAIWHDPMGYYRETLYGKIEGVTTHSYEALKEKVLEIKGIKTAVYKTPIPLDSPLMDPYRDGKAIERFRELLVNSR